MYIWKNQNLTPLCCLCMCFMYFPNKNVFGDYENLSRDYQLWNAECSHLRGQAPREVPARSRRRTARLLVSRGRAEVMRTKDHGNGLAHAVQLNQGSPNVKKRSHFWFLCSLEITKGHKGCACIWWKGLRSGQAVKCLGIGSAGLFLPCHKIPNDNARSALISTWPLSTWKGFIWSLHHRASESHPGKRPVAQSKLSQATAFLHAAPHFLPSLLCFYLLFLQHQTENPLEVGQ